MLCVEHHLVEKMRKYGHSFRYVRRLSQGGGMTMHRFLSACARWGITLASVVLVGVLTSPLWAGTTGKLAGQVVDRASGEPIPGVAVTVEGLRLGAATDADGRYFIIGVPPGAYSVRASLVGYTPITKAGVVVNIDRTTPVDFPLEATAIEVQGVTVIAPREVIQLDVAGSRATLDAQDVLSVPLAHSLTSALSSEPGVTATSIRGGTVDETQLMLNGHYMTDTRTNTFTTVGIPLTSVQEVQVLTSGFNAEYGNVRSGVINVVTRDDIRNYWLSSDMTYAPVQKKWFGSDDAYGENTLEWQVFGSDASMTTPYQSMNLTTGQMETVFKGWLAEAGDNQAKADSLLALWRHRHDVGKVEEPDYTVDISTGGPVPLLEGLSFTASGRTSQTPYLLKRARQAYNDYTGQLTLNYRFTNALKLSVTGTYNTESGLGYAVGDPGGGYRYEIYRGGMIDNVLYKYALYRQPMDDNKRLMGGVTLTHVLSTKTNYEIAFDYQNYNYQVYLWPRRYLLTGALNPEWQDKVLPGTWPSPDPNGVAPWGSFPTSLIDGTRFPFAYELGLSWPHNDSSSYIGYKFRGSLLSQITSHHQVKGGFGLDYATLREYRGEDVGGTGERERYQKYDKSPIQVNAYVQDKIEYEGMILNAGLRLDYFDPNTLQYEPDEPFSNLWQKGKWDNAVDWELYKWLDANKDWSGVADSIDTRAAETHLKIAPRLAISHPLDQHSKVYFNYGHFYTYPLTRAVYGFYSGGVGDMNRRPNPDLDFPRTIQYELAFEREFSNAWYAGLLGQKTEMQYLVRISGYYKDVTGELGWIDYNITPGGDDFSGRYINKHYAEIRGFELRIEKRVGRFFTGRFQGQLSLRDEGNVGNVKEYNDGRTAIPESPYEVTSQAEPSWAMYLYLHTPPDYSAFGLPSMATGGWWLGLSMSYAKGTQATYNPNNEQPPPPLNVRWRDSWGSNMTLQKGFALGRVNTTLYLDISNLFGYKYLNSSSMSGTEWTAYLKSLHFPIDDKNIEDTKGSDRIGDVPSYAKLPEHDKWAQFLNPWMYTLGLRVSF